MGATAVDGILALERPFGSAGKERALQLQSEAGIRIERNTFPIRDETSLELLEEKLKQPEFFKAMVTMILFSCIFMFVLLLLLLLNFYFSLGSIPGSD